MHDHSTAIGTASGTLLSILTVNAPTIFDTMIVAAVGATTSFLISYLLKKIFKKDDEK